MTTLCSVLQSPPIKKAESIYTRQLQQKATTQEAALCLTPALRRHRRGYFVQA